MASYILLINFTDQGIRSIKTWPDRVAAARDLVESYGGSITSLYLTMGIHDAIATIDNVEDESIAAIILRLGQLGNIRTTTLRAFPEADAKRMIQEN